MCGKSSSFSTLSSIGAALAAPVNGSAEAPKVPGTAIIPYKTPVEAFRDLINNANRSTTLYFLQHEKLVLNEAFDKVVAELTAVQTAKSDILDTLLGEVTRNETLERENANLRGEVKYLQDDLGFARTQTDNIQRDLDAMKDTLEAVTDIEPKILLKAARVVRKIADDGQKMEQSDPLFSLVIAATGHSKTSAEMREGSRQIEELAIAIERAHDGAPAR